jgi:hypothetical protein
VILESSIRERMSVSFIVASDIVAIPLGRRATPRQPLRKDELGSLVPHVTEVS